MEIKLDIRKSIDQNAAKYFDEAKKAKRKIEGARAALEKSKKQLEKVRKESEEEKEKAQKTSRKKEWYEKFRWFVSSEGILCIGGRDATSNDIIVKKHVDKEDLIFHTDAPGSPFFIVKGKAGKATLKEAASATMCYSKAWKLGISATEVYYVGSDQVTKEAKSGEHLGKGSFMVYGKRNYVPAEMRLAIGIYEDKVMGGPVEAIQKNCTNIIIISQGDKKPSDIAKVFAKKTKTDLDEIIKVLPAGKLSISK